MATIDFPASRKTLRSQLRAGLAQAAAIEANLTAAAAMPATNTGEAVDKLDALAAAVKELGQYNRKRDAFLIALLRELKE